jgi:putative nucleotidyltransferase with HDIG domain
MAIPISAQIRQHSEEEMAMLLAQLDQLPLESPIIITLSALLDDPHTSLGEIAHSLSVDPTVATRVLRAANSAFFGQIDPITDLTRAIQLMGLESVREIVGDSSLLRMYSLRMTGQPQINAQLSGLWRHAVATGVAARLLARHNQHVDDLVAFAAGLLHDIGKVALVLLGSLGFAEAVQLAATERMSLVAAERQTMRFDHARMGQHICEAWGQPEDICVAVGRHHSVRSGSLYDCISPLAAIVHVGDILARALGVGWWGDRVMPRLDPAASAMLRLEPDDAPELLAALEDEYPRTLAHLSGLFPDRIISGV